MNPRWQLSSNEGENNWGCAPSGTVNHLSDLSSLNDILISHAIDNLDRFHIHKIAVGSDFLIRIHGDWN
ncbi:hypothetical protein E2C01_093451 [Portunus trituberculatus]|uniref:Uncharacterized protein n=1 Tax=Portunus trituberculatus TaxID=210409 RepID=A0A5B7JTJ9_PORTR|nr:hypothetical protein [Portunus trituberculatus]